MSNPLLVPPPHRGPAIPYQELLDHARATLPAHIPNRGQDILLALDVDGTLLTADGASRRTKQIVRDALDAGINIVIATGRGISSTKPVFEELELPTGYSVSSNGAQTVRWTWEYASRAAGSSASNRKYLPELLVEHVFDPRPSAEVLVQAMPDILLGADEGADGMLVSEPFPMGEMISFQRVCSFDELVANPTARMVARMPQMPRDEFEDIIDALPLVDVEVAVGWTAWADICAGGVTKATGLQDLADELGISHQGTIALGDGVNDIEMLQWAGHGVAMGGAADVVIAAANETTGPVDFDGSAAVIEAVLERL